MNDNEDDNYLSSYRDCPLPEDIYRPCATTFERVMRDAINGRKGDKLAEIAHEEGWPVRYRPIPEHLRDPANPFRYKHPVHFDLPNLSMAGREKDAMPASPKPVVATSRIAVRQLQDAHNALSAANHLGVPFNCYVDLGWQGMGYADEGCANKAFQKFTKALSSWMHRTAGICPFYLFVFERSKEKGIHCHGMIHVPLIYCDAFKSWFDQYGAMIGGSSFSLKVWRARPRRDFEEGHQLVRFCYLMKGVDPEAKIGILNPSWGQVPSPISRLLKLMKGYRATGLVSIKRLRFSHHLSPARLREHGFGSTLDIKAGQDLVGSFYALGRCWFDDRSYEKLVEELKNVRL